MKTLAIFLTAMALLFPGSAAMAKAPIQPAGEVIHVGVNGMVCDFCAQSLKKVFLKQDAVQRVDISLEKKLITLDLKPAKTLDDATIKKLVVDAGYDVENIHHMPAQGAKK